MVNWGWLEVGTEDQASGEWTLRWSFLVGARVSGHGSQGPRRGLKGDDAEGVEIAPLSSGSLAMRGVTIRLRISWAMQCQC